MRRTAIGLGLALLLAACGGDDGGSPPPPSPVDQPPLITSGASATVGENSTGTAYQATATDPESKALTYTLGGTDAALFTIAANGAVGFKAAPDFEAPADSDKDNVYRIQVTVSDGVNQVSKDVAITVANAVEGLRPKLLASYDDPATVAPIDGGARLIVIERTTGKIWVRARDERGRGTMVTRIADVSYTSGTGSAALYGVLDAVAAPDFATSGAFYVAASTKASTPFDRTLDLYRYRLNADRTAVSAPETVLHVAMPPDGGVITDSQLTAASGGLAFGPDGFLYLGTSLTSATSNRPRNFPLFGGILRIDVSHDDFPADPNRNYAIPASNPDRGPGAAREMITQNASLFPRRLDFEGTTLFVASPGYVQRFGGQLVYKIETTHPPATLTNADIAYSYGGGAGPSFVTGGPVYRGPVAGLAGDIIFADVYGGVYAVPVNRVLAGNPPTMSRGDDTMKIVMTLGSVVRIAIDPAQTLYFATSGAGGGIYMAEAY